VEGGARMIPKPPRRQPATRKPLRRTRVSKKPKHSAKKVRSEADRLWSLLIRQKNGGRCVLCGTDSGIQAAHIISRRYHATRWDLSNGWPLCNREHLRYTFDPLGWDALCYQRLGAEVFDELKRRAMAGGADPAEALERLKAYTSAQVPTI
jgi:hypothetical protein